MRHNVRPGDACLEVGCHEGVTTDMMHRRAAHVVGVDLSAVTVAAARARFPGVRFEVADAFDIKALLALAPPAAAAPAAASPPDAAATGASGSGGGAATSAGGGAPAPAPTRRQRQRPRPPPGYDGFQRIFVDIGGTAPIDVVMRLAGLLFTTFRKAQLFIKSVHLHRFLGGAALFETAMGAAGGGDGSGDESDGSDGGEG
jgi:SAM-dependent methyltransferase